VAPSEGELGEGELLLELATHAERNCARVWPVAAMFRAFMEYSAVHSCMVFATAGISMVQSARRAANVITCAFSLVISRRLCSTSQPTIAQRCGYEGGLLKCGWVRIASSNETMKRVIADEAKRRALAVVSLQAVKSSPG
jgi:hypothetical protein